MGIKKAGWLNRTVLLPLLVIVTACGEGLNEKELIERAKGYLESRDLNAATLELKNILRNDAQNAEARYLLGKISLEVGDVKTAQKELRRALDAGWDEAAVQVLLAESLFRQGYFNKVLDEIPVKDSYPDAVKADLIGLWAASEAGLGKWDEAGQTIRTGESIAVDSLWLLQSKVRLEIHRKELQTAGQVLEHALKVFPGSQDLWLLSAGLAEENREMTNASKALQTVIDLDPPRTITVWGRQARLSLCQIWLKQQDYAKAQAVIDPVLKTYPGDPLANYLGGLIAFKQGDNDLTEERLLTTLKVMPEHQPGLLLFGALNYARSDYQQAVYYLKKASALRPEHIGTQILLGRAYLMLGQYDEAENSLTFASSKVENNAELLALIGLSRLRGGDTQAGIQQLEKAAAVAPTDTVIRNELARAYMVAGETEQAIKELESILEGNEQQYRTSALLLLASIQAGEFDKALDIAVKLSKQVPDSPMPHNYIAVLHEARQDFLLAKGSYQAALAIDQKNSMALLGLARLDLHAGNTDAARNRYETILKADPENPQALLGLAKIIGRKGHEDDAIQLVEKARKNNAEAIEPRLFLAEYYLRKNNPAEALTLAQEASAIVSVQKVSGVASFDSSVQALLGRAQLVTGNGKEALITLNALVKQKPGWADAHYYLAQAQIYNKDLLAAKESLKMVLQLDTGHSNARLSLGNLELRAGNTEKALKMAQDLQKSKGSEAGGYLLEGDILMSNKKPAQATHAYQKSFDLAPSSKTVFRLYSSIKSAGNTEDAFRILEKWLETNPQDKTVRQFLASVYQASGDIDRAIVEYERVIEQYPDSGAVLNNLAWLYFQEKNEKKRALGLAKKAYQLVPDNVAILDTYGWLLLETGSLEQGLRFLHKAAKASKHNSIHYHLAVALARTGDKDAAVEELKTILKSGKRFPEKEKAKALLQELT